MAAWDRSAPSGFGIRRTRALGAKALALGIALGACATLLPWDFELTLGTARIEIEAGASGSLAVQVQCDALADEPIVLSAVGMPAGAVASFDPSSLTATGTSTLTIDLAATVAVGDHAVTVRGVSGTRVHEAALTLAVTAAPPGFALAVTPETVVAVRGGTEIALVAIERTASFTEPVDLELLDAPPGVTAAFDPDPSLGDASTLTLAVDAVVPAGTYALTVQGSSGVATVATTALALVVAEPDAAGFSLALDTASLTLAQGDAGVVAVTIARTGGFVDPVDLSAALKPAAEHVVVTFDPAAASTQSEMTVSIGSNVPPRTYLVEVRGLSGTLRDTVPLALVVVPGD